MAGASFKMNFSQADRVLGGAVRKVANRQVLGVAIGEQLVSSTIQRFDDAKGPDGTEWKKSGRVKAEGGQTLTDNGHLKGSINYKASSLAVAVGTTDKVKGGIHQFGGTIVPKSGKFLKFKGPGGFRSVKKVTMPARPYIGINEEDIDEAQQTIAAFMAGGFK